MTAPSLARNAEGAPSLCIHVVIATVDRADLLWQTVDVLADQTRQADGVLVVAVAPPDVQGIERARGAAQVVLSDRGLCRQRNRALELLEHRADVIVFLDDDFIPACDYLANVEALFAADTGLVGITGELRADGVRQGGLTVREARAMLAQPGGGSAPVPARSPKRHRHELYGCNMAIRMSAARGMRFDENLPLYGWQEDVDFTSRLGRKGRQISTEAVTGVHLGISGGRTSGKRLGYSQVANVVYLQRKGTMRRAFGNRMMARHLAANLWRSLRPEPTIDRRGRLLGNMIAVLDCLRGRLDPRRILEM